VLLWWEVVVRVVVVGGSCSCCWYMLKLLPYIFHNGLIRLISIITDIKNSNIANSLIGRRL